MPIPENQLTNWSGLGAQTGSANTYASIQNALSEHEFPRGMNFVVYLQGSYPNYTNIRGDSDVDVVVETSGIYYHNVQQNERKQFGLDTPALFTWSDFRDEVRRALINYYGRGSVRQGDKCIKLAGNENRLDADIIPCTEYRNYSSAHSHTKGIRFVTTAGVTVINYPKLHISNGSSKNSSCNSHYKPSIRIFKNARNSAGSDFPSYFLECLLYNVPDACFSSNYASTFFDTMSFLIEARDNGTLSSFVCQNEQHMLFGTGNHQANIYDALELIDDLVELWDNW